MSRVKKNNGPNFIDIGNLRELSEAQLLQKAENTSKSITPTDLQFILALKNAPNPIERIMALSYLIYFPNLKDSELTWTSSKKHASKGFQIMMQDIATPDFKKSQQELNRIWSYIEKNQLQTAQSQKTAKMASSCACQILEFCLISYAILEKRK